MKYIIAIFACSLFQCSQFGTFLCLNKCVSEATIFELIDQESKKHIINPIIIMKYENRNADTLNPNGNKYIASDSIVIVPGDAGTYSFVILNEGFREIKLENIKVKHSGNPFCKMAKPEHFILNLTRIESGNNQETINQIQKRFTEKCCP
jgi:hypothetical protein